MKREIYKSKSGIHGYGLFAKKAFSPREIVYQPSGKIIHAKEINWNSLRKRGYDGFLQVGSWKYLDGRKDPLFRFLNHSCSPNVGFKMLEGKVSFVALSPIPEKTELTFDYSTTMFEELDQEPMPCRCGSKNCRKVIADFRFLPKSIQNKYIKLGVVPSYVLEKPSQKTSMLKKKSFAK